MLANRQWLWVRRGHYANETLSLHVGGSGYANEAPSSDYFRTDVEIGLPVVGFVHSVNSRVHEYFNYIHPHCFLCFCFFFHFGFFIRRSVFGFLFTSPYANAIVCWVEVDRCVICVCVCECVSFARTTRKMAANGASEFPKIGEIGMARKPEKRERERERERQHRH